MTTTTLLLASLFLAAPAAAQLPFEDDGDEGAILRLTGQADRDGSPVALTLDGGGRADIDRDDDDNVTSVRTTSLRVSLNLSGEEVDVQNATFTWDADDDPTGTGVLGGNGQGEWSLVFGDGASPFGFVDDASRLTGNATFGNDTLEILDGSGSFETDDGTVQVSSMAGMVALAALLVATLEGDTEVPDEGDTNATGEAEILVQRDHSVLCWWIEVEDLGEEATAAHVHDGPEGQAGPVAVPLSAPTNGTSAGCTADGAADRAMFERIASEPSAFYVNVHNAPFPGGALRGQLEAAGGDDEEDDDEDDDDGTRADPQRDDDSGDTPAPGLALAVLALVGLLGYLRRRRYS